MNSEVRLKLKNLYVAVLFKNNFDPSGYKQKIMRIDFLSNNAMFQCDFRLNKQAFVKWIEKHIPKMNEEQYTNIYITNGYLLPTPGN